MNNKSINGLTCILGWCFFSALARVLVSGISQRIDPVILCFYTFLLYSIVFSLLNLKNIRNILVKLRNPENRFNILWLNVCTFGAWFFLVYPLKYIEPAIVSTITLGFGPVSTLILSNFIYKTKHTNYYDIIISLLLFVVILYTIFLCFAGIITIGKFS